MYIKMKNKYESRREVLSLMDLGLTRMQQMREMNDKDSYRLEITRGHYRQARDIAILLGIDVSGYPKTLRIRTSKQPDRHFDRRLGVLN